MKPSTALFASIVAICCTVSSMLLVSPSNAASSELPHIIKQGATLYMEGLEGEEEMRKVYISAVHAEWVEYRPWVANLSKKLGIDPDDAPDEIKTPRRWRHASTSIWFDPAALIESGK